MADKVRFELVTPERLVVSETCDMVVVPGAEGNFGVLPGHAPFISTIRAEVIDIHDGGRVTERIYVDGGFAEVTPEGCTVLSEEATRIDEIDRAALVERIQALEAEARDGVDEAERPRLDLSLEAARNKLAVLDRAAGR